MACVAHLGEVARHQPRLTAAGFRTLVIVQATPAVLKPHLDRRPLPFPVVSDPDRTAYRAFGLGRVGWLHFARPDVMLRYAWLMLRGWLARAPYKGEDIRQLGGDFVLSPSLTVEYARPSRAATDRPSGRAILRAVAG